MNIHNAGSFGRHPKYEVVVLIVVTILAAILPEGVHLGGIFLEILDVIAVGQSKYSGNLAASNLPTTTHKKKRFTNHIYVSFLIGPISLSVDTWSE